MAEKEQDKRKENPPIWGGVGDPKKFLKAGGSLFAGPSQTGKPTPVKKIDVGDVERRMIQGNAAFRIF